MNRREFVKDAVGAGIAFGIAPAMVRTAMPRQAQAPSATPDPYALVDPELVPGLKAIPKFSVSSEGLAAFRKWPAAPPLPPPAPQPVERRIRGAPGSAGGPPGDRGPGARRQRKARIPAYARRRLRYRRRKPHAENRAKLQLRCCFGGLPAGTGDAIPRLRWRTTTQPSVGFTRTRKRWGWIATGSRSAGRAPAGDTLRRLPSPRAIARKSRWFFSCSSIRCWMTAPGAAAPSRRTSASFCGPRSQTSLDGLRCSGCPPGRQKSRRGRCRPAWII